MNKPKIGILLSGCGVYDGAEIQESVLSLLVADNFGYDVVCIGIDDVQHHVVNHITGEDQNESRNMMVEAARIARGSITNIKDVFPKDIDALVIPGGFGNAKNLTDWAFNGSKGEIRDDVKLLLVNMVNVGKPIVALCVSPVVVAKALQDSGIQVSMTIGSDTEISPYKIEQFNEGLMDSGVRTHSKTIREVQVDPIHKIISAPCYMMEASIGEVYQNIKLAFTELDKMMKD